MRVFFVLIMALTLPVVSFAAMSDNSDVSEEDRQAWSAKPDGYWEEEAAKAAIRDAAPDKNFVDMPELTRTGRNLAKKLQAKEGFDISIEEAEQFVAYAGRSKHQAYILTLFHLSHAKGNPEWKGKGISGILAVDEDSVREVGGQCGLHSSEDLLKIGNNVCAADRIVTRILNDHKEGVYTGGMEAIKRGSIAFHPEEHEVVFKTLYNLPWMVDKEVYAKFRDYQKIGALIKE
jgi:hypothetical protein